MPADAESVDAVPAFGRAAGPQPEGEGHRAAAGRYAVTVVAAAAALHVLKPLEVLVSAGLMPPERELTAVLSAAAVPLTALAYWLLLRRRERRTAASGLASPALYLLALALAFAVLTVGGTSFSYFYPVFLFLVGLSTGRLVLSSVAMVAVLAAVQERFVLLPWLPPTLVLWALVLTCAAAWLRLRPPDSDSDSDRG